MENIITRKAELTDMDSLLAFEQGVISAERPFDETLKPDPLHYYDIDELIAASHIQLVVAQAGPDLIGCGYARIENSKHYLKHSKHAYLGFMYVVPAYRGKGINKIIVDALKDWAAEQGITEMSLDVYDGNTNAINAYEKAGFKRYMIQMRSQII